MKKSVFVVAALAAMVSGAAYAKDARAGKAMTNAEMEKVTAGYAVYVGAAGIDQAVGQSSGLPRDQNNGFYHSDGRGACFAYGVQGCGFGG